MSMNRSKNVENLNSDSNVATFPVLYTEYGRHNRSTMQEICKIK